MCDSYSQILNYFKAQTEGLDGVWQLAIDGVTSCKKCTKYKTCAILHRFHILNISNDYESNT